MAIPKSFQAFACIGNYNQIFHFHHQHPRRIQPSASYRQYKKKHPIPYTHLIHLSGTHIHTSIINENTYIHNTAVYRWLKFNSLHSFFYLSFFPRNVCCVPTLHFVPKTLPTIFLHAFTVPINSSKTWWYIRTYIRHIYTQA